MQIINYEFQHRSSTFGTFERNEVNDNFVYLTGSVIRFSKNEKKFKKPSTKEFIFKIFFFRKTVIQLIMK